MKTTDSIHDDPEPAANCWCDICLAHRGAVELANFPAIPVGATKGIAMQTAIERSESLTEASGLELTETERGKAARLLGACNQIGDGVLDVEALTDRKLSPRQLKSCVALEATARRIAGIMTTEKEINEWSRVGRFFQRIMAVKMCKIPGALAGK